MPLKPYRASYELENKTVEQTLYLSPKKDKKQCLAWLLEFLQLIENLTPIALSGFTLRIKVLQDDIYLGIYINSTPDQIVSLAQFETKNTVTGESISAFIVKSKEEFDAFHDVSDSIVTKRLQNLHKRPESFPLISNLAMNDLIALLFSNGFQCHFPFVLQFNCEYIAEPSEIDRLAKKWVLKMDFDSSIPRKTRTFLKQSVQKSLQSSLLVDSVLAVNDEHIADIQQLLNDLYYQSIAPFGFTDYPLLEDEMAEDLLFSSLPWGALDTSDDLQQVARRQDLTALKTTLQESYSQLTDSRSIVSNAEVGGKFDVFISYSSRNFNQASAVCHGVENEDIRCWVAPRDISPGQSYAAAIIAAIEECKIFVLVYSEASNQSQHVLREVERAVNQNKIIVPFRIEEAEMKPDLAYFISVCHWLDAITTPLNDHINVLVDTLKKQLVE